MRSSTTLRQPDNAANEVYAVAAALDDALFRLADHATGDARRSGAGTSARDGVNDDRGAPVAENGMLVSTQRDIGRNHCRVASSVGCHNQRKIRNASSRQPRVFGMAGGATEVRASRLEVRRFTFRVLVNMQRVLARRQALDVQLDFDSVWSFAQHGSSDALTLRIFNFHGNRFGSSSDAGLHCAAAAGENH